MSEPEKVTREDLKLLPPAERRAVTVYQQGWGLPEGVARKALCAITQAYGLDPVMGDITIMGGSTLYITAEGMMKKVHRNPKFRRWTKRPATKEEKIAQSYDEHDYVWYVQLWFVNDQGQEYAASEAFGQCNEQNCQLQNASKQKGDPRVMNRMAIKRAQHECTRDVDSFNILEVQGMPSTKELLAADVHVVTDDGIQTTEDQCKPTGVPTADIPRTGPSVDDVMDGDDVSDPKPPEPPDQEAEELLWETWKAHSLKPEHVEDPPAGWEDQAAKALAAYREAHPKLTAMQIVEDLTDGTLKPWEL